MLRVFVVLSPLAAVLLSCSTAPSTAPSTASSDYAGNGQLIGELVVHDRFVILGSPDASPSESTLWPGRFAASLDRLRSDLLVIDVDAPGIGNLTVRLADDAGEFPVGTGGFSFTASQHDLPYTIHGEHEVCYFQVPQNVPQDMPPRSCSATSNGDMVCTSRAPPSGRTGRARYPAGESLAITFVDAQAAAVVAQFSAFTEPRIEESVRSAGFCN